MLRFAPSKNVVLLGGVLLLGLAARYYGEGAYRSAVNFELRPPQDTGDVRIWATICALAIVGSLVGAAIGYRLNRTSAVIMGSVGAAAATAHYSSLLGGAIGAPVGLLLARLGPRRTTAAIVLCALAIVAGACAGAVAGAAATGPLETVHLILAVLLVVGAVVGLNMLGARFIRPQGIVPRWRRVVGSIALGIVMLVAALLSIPIGITMESVARLRKISARYSMELQAFDERWFTRGVAEVFDWSQTPGLADRGLQTLARFQGLAMLDLSGTEIDDESLALLHQWPRLWHLDLMETRVTDEGVKHLATLKWLRYLSLRDTGVRGATLGLLPPGIEGLELGVTAVTDASLKQLAGRALSQLTLDDTHIGDAGVANLAGLPRLHDLHLSGTRVTDLGLDYLAKNNPLLTGIGLRGTQVTSVGLERLSALPRLMWLDLCDTQVTDAAIESLANCRSLLTVLLDGTEVTDEGVARLREALPNCAVRYGDGPPE